MELYVKRKIDGQVFEVRKYIKDDNGERHVWCVGWHGHHVIGNDCEWSPKEMDQFGECIKKDLPQWDTNEKELIEWVYDMHLQNLSGREDFTEAFKNGIEATIEELKELKILNLPIKPIE